MKSASIPNWLVLMWDSVTLVRRLNNPFQMKQVIHYAYKEFLPKRRLFCNWRLPCLGAFLEYLLSIFQSGVIPKLDSKSALLFCYFNNLEYFHQYLNSYDGNCIILIGPVDGHRHCEPDPHYLKQISGWTLLDQHNIRNAFEDLVCIYIKQ